MKFAIIGTYPPRQCGIGTFTNNLTKAIASNCDNSRDLASIANIVAINDHKQDYNYPEEVKFTIRQDFQRDYLNGAKYINYSGADICILEHEFGIFGGESGVYILPLIHRLEIPLITTFHTVIREPSFTQKSIIREIANQSQLIVVMSKQAVMFLKKIYEIPDEKILVIEHGVPDMEIPAVEQLQKKFNFHNRKVLFTFGLLSRNKGIETTIYALTKVVEKYPEVLYIVLGRTHPNVLKESGEEYRNFLNNLVMKHGLQDHVYFQNTFVSEKTLFEYLSSIDIYITPYLDEAQITSGTLSYAVGAGAGVVSTPYWHAQELLADGRGKLFNFKDSNQLADILTELLDDPDKLKALKNKAYEYGKNLRWGKIGKEYLDLSVEIANKYVRKKPPEKPIIHLSVLPPLNLAHFRRLTDDTGIVQHAKYGIPNLKEGYCLDDNSRALLTALMAYRQTHDEDALEALPVYLSYIHYMQNNNGTFHNFLSFNRQFLDEEGSEDAFGRAIWALGYLIRYAPKDAYYQIANEIFFKAIDNIDKITSLRGQADIIIGICHYLQRFQNDERMFNLLKKMTGNLADHYINNKTDDWQWFEDVLSYDNGILPLALFHSYEITNDPHVSQIAFEAIDFLEKITMKNGYLSPVGSDGWYKKGGSRATYAQQAIDVMAMVLLYFQAGVVTRKKHYAEKMFTCYMWFLGENDMGLPLYDHETNGCCDGLESYGVNRNQGAESTLAYLISHLTVLNTLEREHEFKSNAFVKVKEGSPKSYLSKQTNPL